MPSKVNNLSETKAIKSLWTEFNPQSEGEAVKVTIPETVIVANLDSKLK